MGRREGVKEKEESNMSQVLRHPPSNHNIGKVEAEGAVQTRLRRLETLPENRRITIQEG